MAHLNIDRKSEMKPTSAQGYVDFTDENATTAEKTFFKDAVPQIFSDKHTVQSLKRNYEDEIKLVVDSYEKTDGLTSVIDTLFPACTLPYVPNSSIGLTTPKPDWIWGIKTDKFSAPEDRIPDDVQPFVRLGTNMDHIFFAIENKGCEGTMEEVENQALRAGIGLVCGRRQLNNMAEDDRPPVTPADLPTPPPSDYHDANPPTSTARSATADLALGDLAIGGAAPAAPASIDPAQAAPTTPARATTVAATNSTTSASKTGPDYQSYYFTCAWIPTMARIFVHWYEDLGPTRRGLYHMTRMAEFHSSDEGRRRPSRHHTGIRGSAGPVGEEVCHGPE